MVPKVAGSKALTSKSWLARQLRQHEGRHRAGDHSSNRETQGVPDHQTQHLRSLRAQRHADADLLRALGHRIPDHTV